MKRIKLVVAYDGTNYCGWQVQNNGVTIAGVLNETLSGLLGEEIRVMGASRTDSGVHALCNVAVFDTETRIPAEKLAYALNALLPEDISIQRSCEVNGSFHPCVGVAEKTYEYRIYNARMRQPCGRQYAYFFHTPLCVEAMRAGAEYLRGTHDFAAFCSAGAQVKTTVRTIYRIELLVKERSASVPMRLVPETEKESGLVGAAAEVEKESGLAGTAAEVEKEPGLAGTAAEVEKESGLMGTAAEVEKEPFARELILRVTGSGFLYHMVRLIAGTLIQVGLGRLAPEEVGRILESRDRSRSGPTAPAEGLTLTELWYKEDGELV